MQELLKQTESDIIETEKTIKKLRAKRAKTRTTAVLYGLDREILEFEAILNDLRRTKAEIEDYIKRSEKNA